MNPLLHPLHYPLPLFRLHAGHNAHNYPPKHAISDKTDARHQLSTAYLTHDTITTADDREAYLHLKACHNSLQGHGKQRPFIGS